MQTVWFVLTALYAIALAFASGTLTGHIAVGRTVVGSTSASDAILRALFQWTALVGVGLVAGLFWRWRHTNRTTTPVTSSKAPEAASARAAVRPSSNISSLPHASHDGAAARAAARAVDTPLETLLMHPVAEERLILAAASSADRPAVETAPAAERPSLSIMPPSAVSASAPKRAASQAIDHQPRTVRQGYLFAPRIIWGTSRSRIIRAWLMAGCTAAAGAALLYALRNRVAPAQMLMLAAVVVAVTVGPLAQTLISTAASRRLGRRWVQLGTSPAAPDSEVSGTIWLSNQRLRNAVRARQSIRPANVRLFCVRGPRAHANRPLDPNDVLWRHDVAVRADRMTFMTRRLGIPFRFDLPEPFDGIVPEEQDSCVWLVSVDTTMNGLELSEQFVLPLRTPVPAPSGGAVEPSKPANLVRRAR